MTEGVSKKRVCSSQASNFIRYREIKKKERDFPAWRYIQFTMQRLALMPCFAAIFITANTCFCGNFVSYISLLRLVFSQLVIDSSVDNDFNSSKNFEQYEIQSFVSIYSWVLNFAISSDLSKDEAKKRMRLVDPSTHAIDSYPSLLPFPSLYKRQARSFNLQNARDTSVTIRVTSINYLHDIELYESTLARLSASFYLLRQHPRDRCRLSYTRVSLFYK